MPSVKIQFCLRFLCPRLRGDNFYTVSVFAIKNEQEKPEAY